MNDVPDKAPPPAEERLFSLEARVARLTAQYGQIEAGHTQLASSVSEMLSPLIIDVERRVDDLAEQLADVLQTLDEERRSGPVNWPALDADQARREWLRLAAWVDELFVPWCEITRDEVPDCWPMHRPALVELSWLHITHVQAYMAKAPATAAAEWHSRWRPAAMSNIRLAIPAGRRGRCDSHSQLPASRPAPPAPAHQPAAQQLAGRHHWQRWLDEAMAADLEWRRAREQEAAEPAVAPS